MRKNFFNKVIKFQIIYVEKNLHASKKVQIFLKLY